LRSNRNIVDQQVDMRDICIFIECHDVLITEIELMIIMQDV